MKNRILGDLIFTLRHTLTKGPGGENSTVSNCPCPVVWNKRYWVENSKNVGCNNRVGWFRDIL